MGALTSRVAVFDGMTRRTREKFGGSLRAAAALFRLQVRFVMIKHILEFGIEFRRTESLHYCSCSGRDLAADGAERFFLLFITWRNFSREPLAGKS
jgi:hypothetical protein